MVMSVATLAAIVQIPVFRLFWSSVIVTLQSHEVMPSIVGQSVLPSNIISPSAPKAVDGLISGIKKDKAITNVGMIKRGNLIFFIRLFRINNIIGELGCLVWWSE